MKCESNLPRSTKALKQKSPLRAVVELNVRGIVVDDAGSHQLSVTDDKAFHLQAPALLIKGRQRLVVLADRSCFEIFASDGLARSSPRVCSTDRPSRR